MDGFRAIIESRGIVPAERDGHGSRAQLSKILKQLREVVGGAELVHTGRFKLLQDGRRLCEAFDLADRVVVDAVTEVRNHTRPDLCAAVPEVVAQQYGADFMGELRAQHPNIRVEPVSGTEEHLRDKLRDGEADFALAAESPYWRGFGSVRLLETQPQLAYSRRWPRITRENLWSEAITSKTLFWSMACEPLMQRFDAGAHALGVKWTNRCRLSSVQCVTRAAAAGQGIGLIVDVPSLLDRPGLRTVSLNFEPIHVSVFWRGKLRPEIQWAIETLRKLATQVIAQREKQRRAARTG